MTVKRDKKVITLGSGKLYIKKHVSGPLPDSATLEVDANLLGYIKGGASLTYTPTFYDAIDDLGIVSKTIITDEEATFTCGVMTWNGTTLNQLVSTGRVTEAAKKRTLKIGGIANQTGERYLLRFVHKDPIDGDVRITIVGNNRTGFTLAFAKDAETVIDAEFKASPSLDSEGTLIIFEEELSV